MATITGMTAAAMDAIANGMIIGATINGSGHLIFTQQDTSTIDAGNVVGPTGPQGPAGTNGTDGGSYSLDYLSSHNPTAGDVSLNSHKLTNVSNGTANTDAANYGQIVNKSGDIMNGRLAPKGQIALTYASTIAIDSSLGNRYKVTLTGTTALLGNPTNPVDGMDMVIKVTQDATGARALSYGSAYAFSTGLPQPTLSAAANAVDLLAFIYDADVSKWRFVGAVIGFSS
jgi:hypothetical protein